MSRPVKLVHAAWQARTAPHAMILKLRYFATGTRDKMKLCGYSTTSTARKRPVESQAYYETQVSEMDYEDSRAYYTCCDIVPFGFTIPVSLIIPMTEAKDIVPLSRFCRKYVAIMMDSTRLSIFRRSSAFRSGDILIQVSDVYLASSASTRLLSGLAAADSFSFCNDAELVAAPNFSLNLEPMFLRGDYIDVSLSI